MRSDRQWRERGIAGLVLATVFYRFALTVTDPDLWGHVRFGQDTIAARGVVRADAYSYMSGGQPFLNHEWLAEVAFALAYGTGGGPGLIALKVVIMMTVAGLLYRHLLARGLPALRAGIFLILACVVMLMGAQTVRPQLFTYLCFTLLLLTLEGAARGRRAWLWGLPVLFAAWANFHGGWMAGLGVLFAWTVVDAVRGWWLSETDTESRTRTGIVVAAASTAGTLCTPYGLDLWAFVLHIVTKVPLEIGEWLPLRLLSTEGLGYLVIVGISLWALVRSRADRRPELVAVLGCVAAAPLLSARHTPLFAIAAVVVTAEHLASAWPVRDVREAARSGQVDWPFVGLCAFGTTAMVLIGIAGARCVRIDPRAGEIYPVRAVALLRDSGVSGNLALDYNWGEYVIWHLGPRVKVSVDGRWLEAYPEDRYAENMRFMNGSADWDALVRRPETDLVLASREFRVFDRMANSPGWARVYEDAIAGIYVREASPLHERLRATPVPTVSVAGAGSCFP